MITFSENQQKIVDKFEAINNAHWIDNHNGTISCSYCHTWFRKDDKYPYMMKYCPYCNIKMTESEEKIVNVDDKPRVPIPLCRDENLKSLYEQYCINDVKTTYDLFTTQIKTEKPHIDHVIFNGPATIVFWKDGTKTVVKYDGKGLRNKKQAILYAFIRKIYGEGKSYHNILNEIEEVLK